MVRSILLGAVGSAAFSAWLYSAYHWLQSINHRADGVSLGKLLVNGIAALDEGNFKESGHPHVRGLKRGMVAFFVCVLLIMLVAVVGR